MEQPESSKSSVAKPEKCQSPDLDRPKEFNVCPFKLKWAVGMNVDVGVVNLTTKTRNLIAYACSHVVILYDYVSRDTTSLQGHQNAVRSLSVSRDGKWLLSADYEEECACIIWDTETRVPICSLFNPHGKNSLTAVKLSSDAKYLVTVGNERLQVVNLWLWTGGNDEPDAAVELTETSADRVKRISFSDANPAEFMLTLSNSVIFVSWRNSRNLDVHRPTVPAKNRRLVANLCDSCYVSNALLAMTVTYTGFVLVWSNVARGESFDGRRGSCGRKRLIKAVPLQKGPLTSIENQDEIIAIGNSSGQLFFYDEQLLLLYWCRNCGFDSIVSISFDRKSELKRPATPASVSTTSQLNDTASTLASVAEEDESLDDWDLDVNENDERTTEDDAEEKYVELAKEANKAEGKKRFSKEKNDSMEETKPLAASTTTVDIDFQTKGKKVREEPTDCSLQGGSFVVSKFFASCASGKIGRLDVANLICRFVLHPAEGAVTAIATRPKSDYVVTGNSLGLLCLYKYTKQTLMVSKRTPALPNFVKFLNPEDGKRDINHVTCPQTHENLVAVSALRFSPAPGGILACGLESGVVWLLDPNTLDPVDPTPYKHSASRILDLAFSECGKYLAYSDDALAVGVFGRNDGSGSWKLRTDDKSLWLFLGKYRSHSKPVRQILFGKPATGTSAARFFSLGEDRNVVEYDLENSGPYPEPGLRILQTVRIEQAAVPSCMALYPEFGVENFLIVANSEHKFRLLNDQTKKIGATFLGPTFGDPVQHMLVAKQRELFQKRGYALFATSREIGLMILPFDGNPHRIVAMTGHPKKIQSMAISDCGEYLFTLGQNDRSALMWKIKYRSVNSMERLGGSGLSPFYSLIEGGKEGWLFNEMEDLFYYSQILQQGENTTSSRIISDKVSILQLPNLMRAIGFYPTNKELENMMEEVAYKNYAKTGQLVDEVTFEEFVKLYVNHRPAFGVTRKQIKSAFGAFASSDDSDGNPTLAASQFLDVLFGRARNIKSDCRLSSDKLYGEPLTIEEAHACLRRLVPQDEDSASYSDTQDGKTGDFNFEFLPSNITYENFTEEILGITRLE